MEEMGIVSGAVLKPRSVIVLTHLIRSRRVEVVESGLLKRNISWCGWRGGLR